MPVTSSLITLPLAGAGVAAAVAAASLEWWFYGSRLAGSVTVGCLLGVTLFVASFGFATHFRSLLYGGRGAGVRAQMLLMATAGLLCLPFWVLWPDHYHSDAQPVSVAFVVGGVMFGFGMQVADGCASGTLWNVAEGSARSVLALAWFVIGSVFGAWNYGWWTSFGVWKTVVFVDWGWAAAAGTHLGLCALVFTLATAWEIIRHGNMEEMLAMPGGREDEGLLQGLLEEGDGKDEDPVHHGHLPWFLRPPVVFYPAGVVIGVLMCLMLVWTKGLWGVTGALALWGCQAVYYLGGGWVAHWDYWTPAARHASLTSSPFANPTTASDLGFMIGVFTIAVAARRFGPKQEISLRSAAAVSVGGFLMGYGCRLSEGCNIGAYFAGVTSFSLSGWVWLAAALVGSGAGLQLRPALGIGPKGGYPSPGREPDQ